MVQVRQYGRRTEMTRCLRLPGPSLHLKIPADSPNSDTTPVYVLRLVVGGQGPSALNGATTRVMPRSLSVAAPLNTRSFGPEVSSRTRAEGLPPKPPAVAHEGSSLHVAGAGGCTHVGCRCATQDPRACMPLLCGTLLANSVDTRSKLRERRGAAMAAGYRDAYT